MVFDEVVFIDSFFFRVVKNRLLMSETPGVSEHHRNP